MLGLHQFKSDFSDLDFSDDGGEWEACDPGELASSILVAVCATALAIAAVVIVVY